MESPGWHQDFNGTDNTDSIARFIAVSKKGLEHALTHVASEQFLKITANKKNIILMANAFTVQTLVLF